MAAASTACNPGGDTPDRSATGLVNGQADEHLAEFGGHRDVAVHGHGAGRRGTGATAAGPAGKGRPGAGRGGQRHSLGLKELARAGRATIDHSGAVPYRADACPDLVDSHVPRGHDVGLEEEVRIGSYRPCTASRVPSIRTPSPPRIRHRGADVALPGPAAGRRGDDDCILPPSLHPGRSGKGRLDIQVGRGRGERRAGGGKRRRDDRLAASPHGHDRYRDQRGKDFHPHDDLAKTSRNTCGKGLCRPVGRCIGSRAGVAAGRSSGWVVLIECGARGDEFDARPRSPRSHER